MAGSTAFYMAMPSIVRRAMEELTRGVTGEKLLRFGLQILALAAADAVCLFFTRRLLIGASRDIEYEMRADFFAHLLRLPAPWYRKNRTGDLMSRSVNDLSAVRMLIGPGVMQAANSLMAGVTGLVLMLLVSPRLTLTVFTVFPFVALATKVMGEATHRRFTKIQEFFSDISAAAQENFSGVRIVRAFAREASEEARFDASNREYLKRNLGMARLNALFTPLLQMLIGIGFALVLWRGGRQILAGELTVARFVEFNLYLLELIWPGMALGWVVNLWQRGSASWNRMVELWDVAPLPDEQDDGRALRGEVELRGLAFGYDGGPPVLRGVSFRANAGETVALVGRTGAGKTTLLDALLRLEEPPQGTVFLDGEDVRDIPLPVLRRSVAVVPQETFLFSDTLAANIAVGRPGATLAEIREAAEAAGLGPDLGRFPKGLDTIVGERGITLSGGQKQRTALARALLTRAPILILDDAFSSVDTETEARILEGLRVSVTGRTVFLVSHRLSTVRNADRIVVLHKGEVAETGRHEELLARGGLYADLAERQRLEEEVEAA